MPPNLQGGLAHHRRLESYARYFVLETMASRPGTQESPEAGQKEQFRNDMSRTQWPGCTAGLGLRKEHYAHILGGGKVRTNWFEAITENYMDSRGRPRAILRKVREQYPLALHGVSLSIASADSGLPSQNYLRRWKELIQEIQPFLVSDHLCWTRTAETQSHDLLPVCYDNAWLQLVCENVDRVQNFLARPIALENVSSYISWKSPDSEMREWEFLNEVCHRTGCGLLLDINNVCVNSHNHGFAPQEFVDSIDPSVVWQYHVAGHSLLKSLRFDTHGQTMQQEVRDLFYRARNTIGALPVLLERDQDIPDFSDLEGELVTLEDSNLPTQLPDLSPPSKFYAAVPPLLPQSRQAIAGKQKIFLAALFSGRAPSSLTETLRGAGNPSLTEVQSLDVYRQSILARLEDALEELCAPLRSFPQYEDWIRSYIEAIRPTTHNLSDFGHRLAGRLHETVASEIARACFLHQRFFHGQRPGGGWIADPGGMRNVALFALSEEAERIWTSSLLEKEEGVERDLPEPNLAPSRSEEPESQDAGNRRALLLYRSGRSVNDPVRIRILLPFEAGVLIRLLRRQSLEQTMEWLADAFPEVSESQVQDLFHFLVANGLYRP